jgi:hypothetical protein
METRTSTRMGTPQGMSQAAGERHFTTIFVPRKQHTLVVALTYFVRVVCLRVVCLCGCAPCLQVCEWQ